MVDDDLAGPVRAGFEVMLWRPVFLVQDDLAADEAIVTPEGNPSQHIGCAAAVDIRRYSAARCSNWTLPVWRAAGLCSCCAPSRSEQTSLQLGQSAMPRRAAALTKAQLESSCLPCPCTEATIWCGTGPWATMI